ncbi:MAG: hypothetical protein K0S45_1162 [Nitrospira sp.]|jgi:GH15 family glucan-1,4-alpha-glucosidase|nr:hypothetical protein [Nitrospira sp.]
MTRFRTDRIAADVPHFDSPSLFAAILDDVKGGRFSIAPVAAQVTTKQFYWPETNVLITRFLSTEGVGQIEDFMPVGVAGPDLFHQLIRRIKVVRGRMTFRLECHDAAKGTDGLDGTEGTFNMCSFWLVEALTRAGRLDPRKLDEAQLLSETDARLCQPFGPLRRGDG